MNSENEKEKYLTDIFDKLVVDLKTIKNGLMNDGKLIEAFKVEYRWRLMDRPVRDNLRMAVDFIFKHKKYWKTPESQLLLELDEQGEQFECPYFNHIMTIFKNLTAIITDVHDGLIRDYKTKEALKAKVFRKNSAKILTPSVKRTLEFIEKYHSYLDINSCANL